MTKSRKVLSIILAVVMAFAALPMMFASAEDGDVAEPVVIVLADEIAKVTAEEIGDITATTAEEANAAVVAAVTALVSEGVTVEVTGEYTAATDDVDATYVFTVTLTYDEAELTTESLTVNAYTMIESATNFIDGLIASIQEFIDMIKAFFLALDIITLIF